jgi:molybdopterin/thiamine biosynthesis adenylyltransferase
MQNRILNAAAARENANSLAAALGIETEAASELLSATVLITAQADSPSAQGVAWELRQLLQRTLRTVTLEPSGERTAIEVVIGTASAHFAAPTIWVAATPVEAVISRAEPEERGFADLHPVISLVVACYVAGAVVALVTADALPSVFPKPLILDLQALGTRQQLERRLDLQTTYLAGAGAIGNGVLWALRHLDVYGRLDVVDFDTVKDANLQRQIWFGAADIGHKKAERLCLQAQEHMSHLKLVPRVARVQDLTDKQVDPRWLRRIIVAVDSRRARRSLQEELPEEVFDASTTDIREIVLHYSKQPTSRACMGCIYPVDDMESAHATHVAEVLGVSVEDVEQNQISESAALRIMANYPERGLTVESLVGEAYDSLFKSLCAQAALVMPEGRQVFAPFAFVSVLAGTLLAIAMVRRLNGDELDYNYWTVSPWFPYSIRMKRDIEANPQCHVCSVPVIRAVGSELWTPR